MAKGDHIYVKRLRNTYSHHGIDCGDGTAIHYSGDGWLSPNKVIRTDIDSFAQCDEILVRNYDEFFKTLQSDDGQQRKSKSMVNRMVNHFKGIETEQLDFSPDAVVERAESRLGEQAFNIVFHNCEHFSSWCKTGITNSEQVNGVWKLVLSAPEFYRYRTNSLLLKLFEPR